MDEAMKRQMNRRIKETSNDMVMQSKLNAAQKQKSAAIETKEEKAVSRMRNLEQRSMEEQRARNMKNMINAQKQ
jgi:hypothetical protein